MNTIDLFPNCFTMENASRFPLSADFLISRIPLDACSYSKQIPLLAMASKCVGSFSKSASKSSCFGGLDPKIINQTIDWILSALVQDYGLRYSLVGG